MPVIELRPNNRLRTLDIVSIGIHRELFKIVGFGHPETDCYEGALQNGHEFVQIRVPGTKGNIFLIHCDFVRLRIRNGRIVSL